VKTGSRQQTPRPACVFDAQLDLVFQMFPNEASIINEVSPPYLGLLRGSALN
jgi:hypothetical protein